MASGAATEAQAAELRAAVTDRRNIIVAGGAGSGKTTLLNALLAEPAFRAARTIVLEDTAELQVSGENVVQLLTKRTAPQVTLRDLVQTALRLRPDRIIVGEVRTRRRSMCSRPGTPPIPAGSSPCMPISAADALGRLEDLCLEAGGATRPGSSPRAQASSCSSNAPLKAGASRRSSPSSQPTHVQRRPDMTRTNHKNERATRRLIMTATLALMSPRLPMRRPPACLGRRRSSRSSTSITGQVARAAGVIAIVLAGITITFSEGGSGVRKLAFVGLGIAIMFAAVSFFLDFFGFAGGAVI